MTRFFILCSMKKRFLFFVNLCMVISGVIGAGFATGEEIIVYFNGKNPIMVGILSTLFFLVFFLCAILKDSKTFLDAKDNYAMFVKKFIECVCLFSCFIVLCAMLSGAKSVIYLLFINKSISTILGLIVAIFCVVIVLFNKTGLQIAGLVFAPIIFISLIIIVCNTENLSFVGEVQGSVSSSLLYVSLNSIFLITLVSESCVFFKRKTQFIFCFISALTCGVLVVLTLSCVVGSGIKNLPLVTLAFFSKSFGLFYCIVVLGGIVTTVCASALPLVKLLDTKVNCRFLSTLFLFAFAWVVSLFNFSDIVEKLYPIISCLGILVIFLILIGAIKTFIHKKGISKSVFPSD